MKARLWVAALGWLLVHGSVFAETYTCEKDSLVYTRISTRPVGKIRKGQSFPGRSDGQYVIFKRRGRTFYTDAKNFVSETEHEARRDAYEGKLRKINAQILYWQNEHDKYYKLNQEQLHADYSHLGYRPYSGPKYGTVSIGENFYNVEFHNSNENVPERKPNPNYLIKCKVAKKRLRALYARRDGLIDKAP